MPVNPLGYPLDLTGVAPSNLITNEFHAFNTAADRIFVPSGGPFYTVGMAIRHGVTNVLLQPNSQYKLLHLHKDGSLLSRKEVCAVVYITDSSVPSVNLEYHLLGGVYADTSDNIRELVLANPVADSNVSWGHIFGQPVQFTPAEHLHHVDELYGMAEVVDVLERLRVAVLAGDSPAFDAIYQYLHTLITNADYASVNEVIALIGNAPFVEVKTYPTYAALRAVTTMVNNISSLHVATGKLALNDRKGRIFVWDITSTAVDDNDKVIRPDNTLAIHPGRFLAVMQVEADLKNALATLGRRIEPNGVVNADLGTVNRIESGSVNAILTPGDYWLHSDVTDVPDSPETFLLRVWRESATVVAQELICLYSENNYPLNRSGVTYSRVTLDGGATWVPWRELFTAARAAANGLDTDLAATNSTTADLNTLVRTGKYWFGNTNANRPEYNPGMHMEYAELEVICLNSTDVIQHAFNTTLDAYRYGYGGVDYAGHSWSAWQFRAARNGDDTQAFAMYSYPIGTIDPSHGVNAGFLATQFAALWARLTANGIDAVLGTTNVIPDGANLNAVLAVGKYYYGTAANNPFPYCLLEVEAFSAAYIIQTAYDSLRRASRCTYDGGATWTLWVFNQSLDIDSESSLAGDDLNNATTPGDFYYTTTTANRPSNYGLVRVWRENAFIIYQQAQGANNRLYIRYKPNGFPWLPWSELASTTDIPPAQAIHPGSAVTTVFPGSYAEIILPPNGTLKTWFVSGGGGGASAESIAESVGVDETQSPGGQSGVWQMFGIVPFPLVFCEGGGIGTAPRSDYEESPSMAGGANGADGNVVVQPYGNIDVLECGKGPVPAALLGNKFPSSFGPYGRGTAPLAPYANFQGGGGGGNGAYASVIVKNPSTTASITLRVFCGVAGANDNERGGIAESGILYYSAAGA